MRFFKTRLMVGTVMVLFILIVGNIIFFGQMIKEQTGDNTPETITTDPKLLQNSPISVKTVIIENQTPPKNEIQQPGQTLQQNTQQDLPPPNPKPVVIHKRRTRAS